MNYSGEWTMGAIVSARAEEHPDRRAVRFEDSAVTYRQWHTLGNQMANGLLALGLPAHARVAVMLPNQPEYLVAWLGVARAGMIEVPVNTAYKGDLLSYLLDHAQCQVLVIDATWIERLEAILDQVSALQTVIVVGGPIRHLPGVRCVSWTDFVDSASSANPEVSVAPTDVSSILYTSGTTGPSKGVVLTHVANFRMARNVVELMDYGPTDVVFNAFPLYHVNARYSGVLPVMYADGESVLHSRFSVSNFWSTCRREGVTAFNYMGAVLMMLFKQPESPDDADNPVRRAYGAPAPVTIYEDFERRFGVQLVEVYGSTEAGTVTMNTVEAFRIGSCGKPSPYYEVAIHDEEDRPVPSGEVGEIVVRPKEPHVLFERYHGMPEETLEAFRNLWFHTGDRGKADEDGYLYYVDRTKDSIRRRGENISSWEVEKVVTSHDDVAEAAAIGVPSELTEEEVMIVVVLKPGRQFDPVSLLDLCQERLPYYAVPRYVRTIDELPKTPSQRIEKYRLREQGLPDGTWDREEHDYEIRR
ncbi:MAG: AMP-binding protein [Nostocoides sp.]